MSGEGVKCVQQELRIRKLLEELVGVLMTIHKIGNFQNHPPKLLPKEENFLGRRCKTKRLI